MRNLKCLLDKVVAESVEDGNQQSARSEWIVVKSDRLRYETRGHNTHYLVNFINDKRIEVNENYLHLFIPAFSLHDVVTDFKNICYNLRTIPNPAIAIYAFSTHVIGRDEFDFLIDMARNRYGYFTPKQEIYIEQINLKMVGGIDESALKRADWVYWGIPPELLG